MHNFGGQNFNLLTAVNTSGPVSLYWSDPLGGSSNDYDLFRLNAAGTTVIGSSTNIQSGTQDPLEQMTQSATSPRIVIVKKAAAQPRFLHLNANRGRFQLVTPGQTHGHAAAASAFGVAATPALSAFPGFFNPGNVVETFSSDGPRHLFYQPNGAPFTPGNVSSTGGITRQKPDITAADGVQVTGVGGFASPFFGTSAAAPHAAAIAGLVKSANFAFTPAQIRTALQSTAVDIEAPGTDRDSGAGIILGLEAINSLGVPGLPNPELVSFSANEAPGNGDGSIEAGEGATLFVTFKNTGASAANNLVVTLTTSTPGVIIASPNALPYGNLGIGASATNATAFRFTLQPSVPCPQTILFNLTLTTPDLPSPRTISISVRTGLPITTITSTLDAAAPPSGAGFTGATGAQNARLFRDGVAWTCGPTKVFSGTTGTGTRLFDAYTFHTCTGGGPSCVKVSLTAPVGNAQLFVAAYLNSFNPANIGQNYIADAGASSTNGTPFGFQVTIPAGANLIVVVSEVTAGAAAAYNYSLAVDGCITASCPVANQLPVAIAQNVTVNAGPNCTATASIDNGSSDPEGGPLTISQSPAGPYALGTTPVLLTVTDNRGAFAQASGSVTVADHTPPAISCPASITVNADAGVCSAVVNVGVATAVDNCAGAVPAIGVRSDAQSLGAAYPVGTTTITWTATDAFGNSSTCAQIVKVVDAQPPSLSVPAGITAELTNEAGAAVVFTASSSDNCPGVAHSCLPASGSTFAIGTTTVVCTATDLAGNTTTKSFPVTVLGARGVKSNVLTELLIYRSTITDKQDGDRLDRAIGDLQDSLAPALWVDQTHVDPKDGDRAFQEEKDCVNQLTNQIGKSGPAPLQGFVDRIVKSDRLLATVAINEHGSPSTAVSERAAGDQAAANGQFESAIEHYRNAWSQALKDH